MPLIRIDEHDNTSPGMIAESYEVVYIPGLVDTTQPSLWKDGKVLDELNPENAEKYLGLKVNTPTLFTSYNEFVSLCGTKPATFKTTQYYTDTVTPSTETDENGDEVTVYSGFSSDAIPFHNVMFNSGDADPSYVMAKELLAQGLCVLYERLNYDTVPEVLESEPADWGEKYNNYYIVKEEFSKILSGVAPAVTNDSPYYNVKIETTTGAPVFQSGDVYKKEEDSYVLVEQTPADWETSYASYYRKIDDETYSPYEAVVISTKEVVDTDANITPETIPADWYSNWGRYYEKKVVYDKLAETQKPNFVNDTYYQLIDTTSIKSVYSALSEVFDTGDSAGLVDKGNYSIKYLTSGGYPVYEYNKNSIVSKMLTLAETRGDCVAIIDHTDNKYREQDISKEGSLYKTFDISDNTKTPISSEYGAMFTPWATYNRVTVDTEGGATVDTYEATIRGSGAYAYLTSLADSLKTNAPWLAVAGAARGKVRNLAEGGMTTIIPNGVADRMQERQGISVNAITNIKPYGYVIWGNRTLKNNAENLTATSFLNIRNLVSDVKKLCYATARKLTFEQNNDILWINFKSSIAPKLDQMLSGYGISGYKFVRDTSRPEASQKATICAQIILHPVYAVEDFYISILLEDDEVTVE